MNGNQNYNQTNNVIPNPQTGYSNVPNNYLNPPSNQNPAMIPNQNNMVVPNQNNTAIPNLNNTVIPSQNSGVNLNQSNPPSSNTFFTAPNNNQNLVVPVNSRQIANTNTVVGNQVNNQIPVNNQTNTQTNSQIVLGTVSNVSYADTLGDIDTQKKDPVSTAEYLRNSEHNNQFITDSTYNETTINDLNVEGTYNNMQVNPTVDYMNDPQVQENLNRQKKKTVPISKELKTVFILVLVLFIFTFIIPILSDLINKLRFH